MPTKDDFVPECVSHRAEKRFATSLSTANNSQLRCSIRSSDRSTVGENTFTSVYCEQGEVLTGCLGELEVEMVILVLHHLF